MEQTRERAERNHIRTEEPSPCADLPIGVFDSGVGGISVLREMVKILPHERFVFFGDCANAPFGTKSLEEIRRLTFAGVERLRNGVWDGKKGIKAVVIACNLQYGYERRDQAAAADIYGYAGDRDRAGPEAGGAL